jgi:UDP-N-acetyl-D-galactosamine dehydrogenase
MKNENKIQCSTTLCGKTQGNINRVVAVVGLGYVGLPVAVAFGKLNSCIGFDVNHKRILQLKQHIDQTEEVTSDELKNANIVFTDVVEDLSAANFFIVAVPTPVDAAHTPDLTPLESVSKMIGAILKKDDIVVYESTVYPGVTEELCVPILEHESGLKCGVDFKVGYSPERINPGDKARGFTTIRKIVSGCDAESLNIIAAVYGGVVSAGVFLASSIKVAEAAKVIENTQRDLNIALMNELAVIFERMHIDTAEVLEAAGTKWNFLPFRPGLVGGHCIGVDPYYLTYKAELLGYIPQVILAGRRINDNMGRYVARRAVKQLIKAGYNIQNAHASVLGITFKENCPDIRNSKVVDIISELKDYNLQVSVHDPVADSSDVLHEYDINLTKWDDLKASNLLIVAVSHSYYKQMDLDALLAKANSGAIIFDVKSVLCAAEIKKRGYILCRL